MKLIAGLGNPGPRYARSRHNLGFLVVEELARRWGASAAHYERKFEGLVGESERRGERVWLLQPQTFMNLSGRSVAAMWRYYRLELADLLVVVDDLDLAVGQIRLRAGGSAGGHKGMTDIIRQLGSDQFGRLRIGIGTVDRTATVEHVLSGFAPDEREAVEVAVARAGDAVECWLARGIDAAMNEYNRKPDGQTQSGESTTQGPAKGDES